MSATGDIIQECSLTGPQPDGQCAWCRKTLVGRQRRWCSRACTNEFIRNHRWTIARKWALKLANRKCAHCGAPEGIRWDTKNGRSTLEVNHVEPVRGDRRSYSCQNHLANLVVLCVSCHSTVTSQQRREGLLKRVDKTPVA